MVCVPHRLALEKGGNMASQITANIIKNGEPVDKINFAEEKIFTQKNVLSVLDDRTY